MQWLTAADGGTILSAAVGSRLIYFAVNVKLEM